LVPDSRPGDFAQALMDLGATVCTPRKPRCVICPWRKGCVAAARGEVERFPVKAPKRRRPLRHGVAFVLVDRDGAVWLTRRAPRGLLGGLQQAPTTAWRATPPTAAELCCARPISARWRRLPGEVRHGFTHFELVLAVELARLGRAWPRGPGAWWPIDRLAEAGLPTLMRKVLAHAVAHATGRR
jgi:A/G-specific adenine glycosylase